MSPPRHDALEPKLSDQRGDLLLARNRTVRRGTLVPLPNSAPGRLDPLLSAQLHCGPCRRTPCPLLSVNSCSLQGHPAIASLPLRPTYISSSSSTTPPSSSSSSHLRLQTTAHIWTVVHVFKIHLTQFYFRFKWFISCDNILCNT